MLNEKLFEFRKEVEDLTRSVIEQDPDLYSSFQEENTVYLDLEMNNLASEIQSLKNERDDLLKHFDVKDPSQDRHEEFEDPYISERKVVNDIEMTVLEDEKRDILESEINELIEINRRNIRSNQSLVENKVERDNILNFSKESNDLIEKEVENLKNEVKNLKLSIQKRRCVKLRSDGQKRLQRELKKEKINFDRFVSIQERLNHIQDITIPVIKSKI